MNKYYLRIEGVNFDSFVLDSNVIKVIRGGSLMLLNSVEWLAGEMKKKKVTLDKITAGASWGLFSFREKNDFAAGVVLKKVRDAFDNDPQYQHATMTVEVLPAGKEEEYPQVRSRLEALSRWHQLQSPTVAIPSCSNQPKGACEFDKLRPATETASLIRPEKDKKKADISAATRVRWEFDGKERKPHDNYEGFYEKRTDVREDYTSDLQELTAPSKAQDFGNLNGKMAVIYLDGNNFGKRARGYCTTENKQNSFDKQLRKKFQDGALKELLTDINKDDYWKNNGNIRLDTLLWGGDEIIWVAPAWKGWWMLARFFEITQEWELDGDDKPLTHGAGLVFCHHNAPIKSVISLVKSLGDLAKGDRIANRVAYEVLESFDHMGADLEAARKRRWPLTDAQSQILSGNDMFAADKLMRNIKRSDLPKRQLYRIARTARGDVEKALALANSLAKEHEHEVNTNELERCFNGGLASWLHMLELWDYVGLEVNQ